MRFTSTQAIEDTWYLFVAPHTVSPVCHMSSCSVGVSTAEVIKIASWDRVK